MENLLISIPEPCHEDWGKMTPEERGRFCGKCSKTVFDFSNKTNSEIQQYLNTHQDKKLCGRFRNDQLIHPVTLQLPVLKPYRIWSPLQVFAMAVLLAFGTSLFSCTTPQGQTVGKINIKDADILKEKTSPASSTEEFATTGIIAFCADPEPAEQHIKGDTIISKVAAGEVSFDPDTIFKTLPVVEIEASVVPLVDSYFTGLIMVETKTTDAPVSIEQDSNVTVENRKNDMPVPGDDFNSHVYPNPTNGLLNVDISTGKADFVKADLYDASGRYVGNLFTKQAVQPGLNSLQSDMSGYPPGIYLLKLLRGNKTITEKVVLEKR
ncbi:MAG TPA: T9SS type A sorting domain-containing protein [Bacteroidia bacterium]|nr:T9SS type A sorting domain-containing protein [Bacteroidia bacterium]